MRQSILPIAAWRSACRLVEIEIDIQMFAGMDEHVADRLGEEMTVPLARLAPHSKYTPRAKRVTRPRAPSGAIAPASSPPCR